MFEVLVELTDGTGTTAFVTYDVRHTKDQAEEVARDLRRKKKVTKVIDRDYKKPPRGERNDRRGRRFEDDEE